VYHDIVYAIIQEEEMWQAFHDQLNDTIAPAKTMCCCSPGEIDVKITWLYLLNV
jgi:hypothetical protein